MGIILRLERVIQRMLRSDLEINDPILLRCPKCEKLFQPDHPVESGFAQLVARIKLEHECPNHLWPEVLEN